MTRKPISPADSTPVRVVLVTLDNHMTAAVDGARHMLAADLPGLRLSVHAATDWAENPASLERCRAAILEGDIVIVSMIFVEEHVRAIADVLEARHRDCDAMVCCMSAGTIMKYTSMGRFRMGEPQKGPLALLKKLRGGSSRGGRDSGKTAGERQLAMLRRLPKWPMPLTKCSAPNRTKTDCRKKPDPTPTPSWVTHAVRPQRCAKKRLLTPTAWCRKRPVRLSVSTRFMPNMSTHPK